MYYSFPAFARLAVAVHQTPEPDEVKHEPAEPLRGEQLPPRPSNSLHGTALE